MIPTMRRFVIFLFLLSASFTVAAQALYKWVEPDGSITFSPKKPPAGVEFEVLNELASDRLNTPKVSDKKGTPKVPAIQKAMPGPSASESATSPVVTPEQMPAPSSLTIAPTESTDGNRQGTNPRGFISKPASKATAQVSESQSNAQQTKDAGKTEQTVRNSLKQQQCQDLQKRVVSLERRLRSRLTPEDMDNTVIHMARYQRSYDQHCVQ